MHTRRSHKSRSKYMCNKTVVVAIVSLLLLAATTAEAAMAATTVATSILSLSVLFLPVATALSVVNKNHNGCHNNKIASTSNEHPTTTMLSLTATTGSSTISTTTTSTTTPIIPNYERAKVLNSHLQTLLEFEPNAENNNSNNNDDQNINNTILRNISAIDIMDAALRWGAAETETKFSNTNDPSTSNNNSSNNNNSKYYITDPRFGRPALRTYHSFVVSDDRYDDDPILLDGLARKKAKQIHHMIQQRQSRQTRTPAATTTQQKNNNTYKKNGNNNPPQHLRDKVAHSIAKGERRARERSNQRLRTVCSGCSRPFNLCLCEVLGLSNTNNNNANSTNTNMDSATSHQQHPSDNTNGSKSASTTASMMSRSRIVVLQHPNEFRKKHTSTVPLLKLVLGPENVRVKVGYEFTQRDVLLWDENDITTASDDDCTQRPIMLFPGPDAMDLDQYVLRLSNQQDSKDDDNDSNHVNNSKMRGEEEDKSTDSSNIRHRRSDPITTNEQTRKTNNKTTLVLIDGTWAEAKRILRKSTEILETCQMIQFAFNDDDDESSNNGGSRSIYNAMRREPEDHCLSTLEACGQALELLEGPEHGPKIQTHMLEVLSKHVELHLANAKEAAYAVRKNRDSTNKDLKLKRAKEIEWAIFYANRDGGNKNSHKENNSDTNDDTDSSTNRAKRKNIRPVRPIPTATTKTITTTIADTPTRLLRLENDDTGSRKSSAAIKTNDDDAAAVTVTIRRLTHEDIPTIDDWWENSSSSSSTNPKHKKLKSITTITRSIESDYGNNIGASLGIVDENDPTKLIACILRYESGPLGILHVQESHRGKGYGTALLKEATQILAEYHHQQRQEKEQEQHNLECTAFIKDGNLASQHVFSKAGWIQENPNAKKGSGKRRANRKWIFPPRE
uniref:tRNA-uridine aminocarboxypropyltransferase n=1 Tax=Pseudo-nitzschia australis TaxID=44445 RepID=A0A7S4EHS0_9STRA